ncbi:MAG: hypothetical protein WD766_15440 [Gemmatimonadota bacterium]
MNVYRSTIFAVGLLLASVHLFPLAAQSSAAGTWVTPRTEWGHPDLQGSWTNTTLTPLERPEGFGPFATREEAARIAAMQAEQLDAGLNTGVGTYDAVYIDAADDLASIDGQLRSSMIVDPPDGRVPPLTAEAQERIAAQRAFRGGFGQYDNPENRPLAERCFVSFGSNAGPPMTPNGAYNNNYTIVQNRDHIMIVTEMVHDTRIIRLGDPEPLPEQMRPWFGDSWGTWEGDTLVVETTNFHPLQQYRGIPTDNLKVTERFHRSDERTILYRFTVEDPTTYTRPWSGELPMIAFDDYLYEYACHEGNYALYNVLRGARAQERMQAEAAASEQGQR